MSDIIEYKECPLCKSKEISLYQKIKDHPFSQEVFDIFECKKCTFLFTQNIPTQEKIGYYYQAETYVSHTNTTKGLFFKLYHVARSIMLNKKQKLIEKYSGKKTGSILDIGAATGYFLNHMKNNGFHATAVEVDEDSRKFCEDKFNIKSTPPIDFFAKEQPKFDIITMWHVMEHVHDMHMYVDKINELLDDDGIAVIAVPNHAASEVSFFKEYWDGYDVPRHLWHFEPQTMEQLFDQHGFQLIKKKSMPFDSFYISILSFKWKKNPLHMIFGLIYGFIPFFKQMINVDKSSSLTYIFKKKK